MLDQATEILGIVISGRRSRLGCEKAGLVEVGRARRGVEAGQIGELDVVDARVTEFGNRPRGEVDGAVDGRRKPVDDAAQTFALTVEERGEHITIADELLAGAFEVGDLIDQRRTQFLGHASGLVLGCGPDEAGLFVGLSDDRCRVVIGISTHPLGVVLGFGGQGGGLGLGVVEQDVGGALGGCEKSLGSAVGVVESVGLRRRPRPSGVGASRNDWRCGDDDPAPPGS